MGGRRGVFLRLLVLLRLLLLVRFLLLRFVLRWRRVRGQLTLERGGASRVDRTPGGDNFLRASSCSGAYEGMGTACC
ncbi:hypothetical protein VR44_01650 [Streptomyces katrae]|uniref:Uncharacterized protein n=1 Tax=Streptomyces katrae TaxID=68223 RepID=A0A0F4K2K1_9ACTN|nr:hypothetical protein VR44_01650 [Streptomyces katrae]